MSNSKLFVGNLPHAHTSKELETMFAPFGTVKSAQVIVDRMTGQSRGFGFVEMETPEQAEAAKAALNGSVVGGRTLTVNEARERTPGGFG
ncbi:MAG: RNA-binding protein, partial [Alphaproteobacteria bacterium]|nr:RNA-binding protein [Alphaproteobacteria bacterium]